MKNYNYYLFDADGTLIDTLELICRCFEKSLAAYGNRSYSRSEIMAVIGTPLADQFVHHLGPQPPGRLQEIMAAHMEYQLSIYSRYLRPMSGAIETLEYLVKAGKSCAVVTSRRRASLELFLKICKLDGFFKHCVTPEDTVHHKPHAEPALKALALLGAAPGEALFIGDSEFDVQCGHSAGMDTALLLSQDIDPAALAVAPTVMIRDLTELCGQKAL
jgi:pyrophosphatase PpaX